jgi:hypothetical protein
MTDERSHRTDAVDSFAVLALVITFVLRYTPFLTSHLLFGPFLDNVHIFGPIFSEISRLALSDAVPYYLPDIGTGFPVFESPHFSILYPFYFFELLDYGGPLASLYTLTHLTLLHIFIFYINLYVLLRCATVRPWAAYVGASVGMLARNTELYASWVNITASYAWLPLMLAGGVLLLQFPGKASGIIVFSVAAGLLTLASPAQSVIHAALACLILFAVGVVWMCLKRRFAQVRRLAWSLIFCSGIAFGFAGAAILPMSIATGQMIRHIGRGAAVIGHAPIPWEHFNLHQLTLDQATSIVVRPTWISIVGSPYVGPLGVIGTLLTGIYFRRLDRLLRMLAVAFGIISLYGLLSGFGTNLGLAYVNFHLPLVNRIREAGRHLVLFVIGASFLSGLGYSLLARSFERYKENRNPRQLIVPALAIAVFTIVIIWELPPKKLIDPELFLRGSGGLWVMTSVPLLFALGKVCRVSGYAKVVSAAMLVSAAAVVIPIRGISLSLSDFNKPMNLLSHRVLRDFVNKIDAKGYRMNFRDSSFPVRFWAMNASYYGIKSFYNQLTPQPFDQVRFGNLANVPHLREMMGARYVLCGPNDSPLDPNAKSILETERYRLYENRQPMGRLTLLHRVAGFAKNENKFKNLIREGFDYFSTTYVTASEFETVQSFLGSSQSLAHPRDRIVQIVDQPNRSYSTVVSASTSLLVLNEWFTPAWKVRVNGKTQSALRVNQWQTGVLLPAGKNRVEFDYRPTLFGVLMVLNRITLVLLLIFVIFVVVRKQRRITTLQSSSITLA